MILHLGMAEPRPAAHLGQKVRRAGHGLHAARDHRVRMTQGDLIKSDHRRLHARAAHFVEGGGGDILTQAPGKSRLTRGGLPLTRRQNAAHQHLVHGFGAGIDKSGPNRRPAQNRGLDPVEIPLETAHRRAGGARDDNLFHRLILLFRAPEYRMVRNGV
jgi:hypothetical protein